MFSTSIKARTHWAHFPSADSRGFKILNMFDMDSRPTIVKSVVESANSGIETADSTADSAIIPLKIGLWVWTLSVLRNGILSSLIA